MARDDDRPNARRRRPRAEPADIHEFRGGEPTAAPPARPVAEPATADEGWLDALLDTMAEAALVVDADGMVVRLNAALRRAHPWLRIGMNVCALDGALALYGPDGRTRVPPEDWPIHRVLRGETLESAEYVAMPTGQPPYRFRLGARPLRRAGRPAGALFVAEDVTARRLAEARFQAMFEATTLGVALLDREGRFVASNPAVQQMLGATAAQLLGSTTADFTEPADQAREQALRRRLLAGELGAYEVDRMRVRSRDGRLVWVRKNVFRFPGLRGDDDLVLCMAQDITAEVAAEKALRGSEARLRALVEGAPAVIAVCDLAFRYLYVNRAPAGLAPDALIGRNGLESLLPGFAARVERARDEVVATGQPRQVEVQAWTSDGTPRWYDVSLGPIVEEGAVVALVTLSVDTTERHRAADRLAEHDALMAEAERSARFGCWRLDVRTGQSAWSDGMYRLLGYEPGAIPASVEAYLDRLHPAQRAALGYDAAAIRAGEVAPVEDQRVVRVDGEERVLRFAGRIERDAEGRPVRVIGVAQDVTEKVLAERAKSDFLAVVSHEMRTPLTVIRAPLLMVRRGALDPGTPQGQAMLDLAVQGVERMTRLVEDIHDLHRLESGSLTMRPTPVAGADLVAGAVAAMGPIAATRDVRLVAEAGPVEVLADADRVTQVLTNLIENAVKFSPAGGTVQVALAAQAGEARFMVADEGPGVPADRREAIFDRYVQLGADGQRHAGGLGLGLAIAREIVSAHGGRIWVEPREGGGSRFAFTLRLADGVQPRHEPEHP